MRTAGKDAWVSFDVSAGAYLASLDTDHQAALREECRRLLPASPVEISATAWAATSRTSGDHGDAGHPF
jgi:hypothetical protein